MSFTKANVRKTHTKAQADQFVSAYGFTKFETYMIESGENTGEFVVILDTDISDEQASRYLSEHPKVFKIEGATCYWLRDE